MAQERRYQYGKWLKAKVHLDYHVEHDRRFYSVPHALVGKTLDVRVSDAAVEIYHRGERVAAHLRGTYKGQFATDEAHRPATHRHITELSHERLLRQAAVIGEATAMVIRAQAQHRKHRDQTLRTSMGILRLAKDHGAQSLETACARAVTLQSFSYRSIVNLLKHPPHPINKVVSVPIEHANVRGADYYGAIDADSDAQAAQSAQSEAVRPC